MLKMTYGVVCACVVYALDGFCQNTLASVEGFAGFWLSNS